MAISLLFSVIHKLDDEVGTVMSEKLKLTAQEQMKVDSAFLKGNIAQELNDDSTDYVSDYAYEMLKFHGSYQGHNRDTATARKKQGLDKEYEFMVRARIPAGIMTAAQYLAFDELAGKYANDSLRITTRQAIQFHVILKKNMVAHITAINKTLLSTQSGCGDVVRNVTTSPAPYVDHKYAKLRDDAKKVADFVVPKTSSYKELWLDEEVDEVRERSVTLKEANGPDEKSDYEPLYGATYLPRKFKIGLIIPEDNSIDAFTHDLGIVLVYEGDEFKGYNLLVGGGMGMDHEGKLTWAEKKTFPRLATPLGFVGPDDLLNAVEAVVKIHRDFGGRESRKHARLKYVLSDRGVEWTKSKLAEYFAETSPKQPIAEAVEVGGYEIPTHMGWHEQGDGKWFLGVPVPSGRIVDYDTEHKSGYTTGENIHFKDAKYRSALRKVVAKYGMNVVLTPTEEIILCDVAESDKADIESLLASFNVRLAVDHTKMELHFMACVSLPTCHKALAESERVQFALMDSIQEAMDQHGVGKEKVSVRVTGCPNGCARPYVGDIGIVGRMPGHYLLFIGGDFAGTRLSVRVFDKVPQADVAKALEPMFASWAKNRNLDEGFGDYCHRVGEKKLAQDVISSFGDTAPKWASVVD